MKSDQSWRHGLINTEGSGCHQGLEVHGDNSETEAAEDIPFSDTAKHSLQCCVNRGTKIVMVEVKPQNCSSGKDVYPRRGQFGFLS